MRVLSAAMVSAKYSEEWRLNVLVVRFNDNNLAEGWYYEAFLASTLMYGQPLAACHEDTNQREAPRERQLEGSVSQKRR